MRRLAVALFAFALGLPVVARAAAVDIHVTTNADSGPGTLRQAILDGNALSSTQYPNILIDLASSAPITLSSPLPEITSKIAYIKGNLGSHAVVDGQGLYSILRASSSTVLFTLTNVILRRGYSTTGGACLSLSATAGVASVDNDSFLQCTVSGTYAGGGAIDSGISLSMRGTTFYDDSVQGTAIDSGGAIRLYNPGASPSLSIDNCSFTSNSVTSSSNQFGQPAEGGAVYVQAGDVTIYDSEFSDNRADEPNMANAAHGGAVTVFNANLEVHNTMFYSNFADAGGALFLSTTNPTNDTATLVNNTFTFNLAQDGVGGALKSFGDVTLRNNTFAQNSTDQIGSSIAGSHYGTNAAPVLAAAWNNLIDPGILGHDWCNGFAGANSAGYNIVPQTLCGVGGGSGSHVTTHPHLVGLGIAASGAPLDVAMFADSPAVDGGNPAAVSDTTASACPSTDADGMTRPADGNADGTARCDIGAFEWQHEAPLFFDDFEDRVLR